MKRLNLLAICLLLMTGVLWGCSAAQSNSTNVQTAPAKAKPTTVTKDILKTRLAGKNVQFVEELDENAKPNPLYLSIKIVESGADGKSPLKVTLNNGDKQSVSELTTQLRSIFKDRADNGVFQEGKNEVDKRINIAASDDDITFYNKENIYVEDFEKLIDELQKAEIDQISINFAGSAMRQGLIDQIEASPNIPTKKKPH